MKIHVVSDYPKSAVVLFKGKLFSELVNMYKFAPVSQIQEVGI